MEELSIEKIKELLSNGVEDAKAVINDKSKMSALLSQVEEKIKTLPLVGEDLTNIPKMISMVKNYITKEYTAVSVKVVASVVSAFLYLVKRKDFIPDSIPVVGLIDDVAIITVAMKLIKPEIEAYKKWEEEKTLA